MSNHGKSFVLKCMKPWTKEPSFSPTSFNTWENKIPRQANGFSPRNAKYRHLFVARWYILWRSSAKYVVNKHDFDITRLNVCLRSNQ